MFISAQHAQNIVDEMKASIHRDINIMDGSGTILASTNPARRGQLHYGAAQIIRDRLPSLTIWADSPESGVQRGINLPITLEGKVVGVIGITGDPREVSLFGDIIKRMTEIMVESARQQEQSDLMDQARGLFVENWLFSDGPDWGELEIRGRLLGLEINAPYTVALLQLTPPEPGAGERAEDFSEMRSSLILRMVRAHLQDSRGSYCAVVRNRIIVLLRKTGPRDAYARISGICQDIESFYGVGISGGISDSSRSPMDIRRCYLAARTAGQAAARSPRRRVVFYDEVSLEFIVQSIPDSIKEDLRKLIFSSCTPQEREEFTQTILLYFDRDGDVKACAQQLYLHRNTFQYRIDRLRKKTGYDLRVPKDFMLLYLAAQEEA